MGVQDLVALTVVAGAAWYVARVFYRMGKGRAGCGCETDGKKSACSAQGAAARAGITRVPLISTDQIGKPYQATDDKSS